MRKEREKEEKEEMDMIFKSNMDTQIVKTADTVKYTSDISTSRPLSNVSTTVMANRQFMTNSFVPPTESLKNYFVPPTQNIGCAPTTFLNHMHNQTPASAIGGFMAPPSMYPNAFLSGFSGNRINSAQNSVNLPNALTRKQQDTVLFPSRNTVRSLVMF